MYQTKTKLVMQKIMCQDVKLGRLPKQKRNNSPDITLLFDTS